MPIDLYYALGSPPCRSVLLLAKALKLELNLKETDLPKGEHRTPEFLKLNPQHAIPTITDNGLSIGESRAILAYLVDLYGKDESLYPKDPRKRVVVDQRLYFDAATLNAAYRNYYLYPKMFTGSLGGKPYLEKLEDAFSILDKFLEGQDWVAGNSITIADFSIVSTVASVQALGFDISRYPNVAKWYARAQKTMVGHKEINEEGARQLKEGHKKLEK